MNRFWEEMTFELDENGMEPAAQAFIIAVIPLEEKEVEFPVYPENV